MNNESVRARFEELVRSHRQEAQNFAASQEVADAVARERMKALRDQEHAAELREQIVRGEVSRIAVETATSLELAHVRPDNTVRVIEGKVLMPSMFRSSSRWKETFVRQTKGWVVTGHIERGPGGVDGAGPWQSPDRFRGITVTTEGELLDYTCRGTNGPGAILVHNVLQPRFEEDQEDILLGLAQLCIRAD